MINGKKIGLALGGGAAKGFAHIGVLKVLENNGIVPDIVVGTSMGSVIGGIYSSGMSPDKMEQLATNLKLSSILDLNAFKILKEGVVAGKKLIKYIDVVTSNAAIENMHKQYACVACDILTGNQYVIKQGKLSVAVRCSSAMPGIFAPYQFDDMLLIDGGVVNNIPTDVVYDMGADYIISVDCIGNGYLTGRANNALDFLMSSFSITQYRYEKNRKSKANIKIIINSKGFSYVEHSKDGIKSIIQAGEIAAKKKIKKIKCDLGI